MHRHLALLHNSFYLSLFPSLSAANQKLIFDKKGSLLKRCVCSSSSVALLKSIQVLSLRPDLLSKLVKSSPLNTQRVNIWNDVLSTVVDSVPPTFSSDQMLLFVDRALGRKMDVFEFLIDPETSKPECVASATIELQVLLRRVLVDQETGRIDWGQLDKLLDLAASASKGEGDGENILSQVSHKGGRRCEQQ